jgi:hypothetical protein
MVWGCAGVTFTYGAISVAALVFALVAGIKYNSVKVFNRSIRTENISNTLWILFYIFIALRFSPALILVRARALSSLSLAACARVRVRVRWPCVWRRVRVLTQQRATVTEPR